MPDGVADEPLKIASVDLEAVGARAFRSDVRAPVVAGVAHGERGSARAAEEQARKQVLRTMRAVERDPVFIARHLGANLGLLCFHTLPKGIIDDPQVVVCRLLPLVFWVRAGQPFPGARVADVGASVPDEPADVELIVEKTRTAVDLPSNGRVDPFPAARAGDAFPVQGRCNGARGGAMSISFEDASDDLGFLVKDDALSLGVRVDLVTVAERSCT